MDIKKLMTDCPVVSQMADYEEIFWLNPSSGKKSELPFGMKDIDDAEARLARFAPYLAKAFPETAKSGGIIESDLVEIARMKTALVHMTGAIPGRLFLKCDSHLPVSGSIKARGGIYEVLKFAEKVAMEAGKLTETDDYSMLLEDSFKDLFAK